MTQVSPAEEMKRLMSAFEEHGDHPSTDELDRLRVKMKKSDDMAKKKSIFSDEGIDVKKPVLDDKPAKTKKKKKKKKVEEPKEYSDDLLKKRSDESADKFFGFGKPAEAPSPEPEITPESLLASVEPSPRILDPASTRTSTGVVLTSDLASSLIGGTVPISSISDADDAFKELSDKVDELTKQMKVLHELMDTILRKDSK